MAKWIKEPCVDLLKQLNDVPFDDDREDRQLTLLMSGISNLTREMMLRAAVNVRKDLGEMSGESAPNVHVPHKNTAAKKIPERALLEPDSLDDELDMIEKTLIQSIGE